jgi:hypothetical protein
MHTAARKEEVFLAWRVAIPRQRFRRKTRFQPDAAVWKVGNMWHSECHNNFAQAKQD